MYKIILLQKIDNKEKTRYHKKLLRNFVGQNIY